MFILGKLDQKIYKVYTLEKIKKLKKSTTVKLYPTDEDGKTQLPSKNKTYNMPDQEIQDNVIILKYKGKGYHSTFNWKRNTNYSICEARCLVSDDLTYLYKIASYNNCVLAKRYREEILSDWKGEKESFIQNMKQEVHKRDKAIALIKLYKEKIALQDKRIGETEDKIKELSDRINFLKED